MSGRWPRTALERERALAAALRNNLGERVQDGDPYRLGVERSLYSEAGGAPYTPRELDVKLDQLLAEAGDSGGLVALKGAPKAGKTRTLWEAIQRHLADYQLVAVRSPVSGEGDESRPLQVVVDNLDLLPAGRKVVWLDDAQDHLGHGLTLSALKTLTEHGLVVALTMHNNILDDLSGRTVGAGDRGLVDRDLAEYLSPIAVELRSALTDQELADAELTYPDLAGETDLRWLAEYFAGTERLWGQLTQHENDQPEGVAVARAVIDWRRCGMPPGITTERLRELATITLHELAPAKTLDDASFAAGLDWASTPIAAAVALVRPVNDIDANEARHDSMNWLVDRVSSDRPPPVDAIWEALLRDPLPDDALSVGMAAYLTDRDNPKRFFENAWQAAANSEDAEAVPTGMINLAVLREGRGIGWGRRRPIRPPSTPATPTTHRGP